MVKEITTINQFVEIVSNNNVSFVVIDFFADWCGPCKKIAPFIEKLSEKYPSVIFCKINSDRPEFEHVCQAYKVSGLPTFSFFRTGIHLTNVVGASEQNLEGRIVEILQILDTPKN